jgi:hypothetical protein
MLQRRLEELAMKKAGSNSNNNGNNNGNNSNGGSGSGGGGVGVVSDDSDSEEEGSVPVRRVNSAGAGAAGGLLNTGGVSAGVGVDGGSAAAPQSAPAVLVSAANKDIFAISDDEEEED